MAGLKKASGKARDEVESVVYEIEQEEMRHLNEYVEPDEDGIVRNIPLLAGYTDSDGVLHDTFSFREMTGRDEEAISKADVRANGSKLVNVLCERCVTEIGTITKKSVGSAKWGQIIREMLGGDLVWMAFKIREVSKGREVTFTHICPYCGAKLETTVDTDEFEITPYKGVSSVEFSLPRGYRDLKKAVHKDGVLRLPNGLDMELVTPLIKKNTSSAMTVLLTRLVSFSDGATVSQACINEMSLRDREVLEKIIKENDFGISTNFDLICDSCGRGFSAGIAQSNFF